MSRVRPNELLMAALYSSGTSLFTSLNLVVSVHIPLQAGLPKFENGIRYSNSRSQRYFVGVSRCYRRQFRTTYGSIEQCLPTVLLEVQEDISSFVLMAGVDAFLTPISVNDTQTPYRTITRPNSWQGLCMRLFRKHLVGRKSTRQPRQIVRSTGVVCEHCTSYSKLI